MHRYSNLPSDVSHTNGRLNGGGFTSSEYSRFDDSESTVDNFESAVGSDSESIVTKLIKSSSLYKEADQILSSDSQYGASYLSMLRMVPYSHEVRDENFWDSVTEFLGSTSGYDKAVTDAFNAAMDEIRSLMQDYYSFLSKLPKNQVSQLQEAGINAAITGEGVTTSSMTSPDPSSIVSTDPPQAQYDNTVLSQGVTSFVEFIGSMANLASVGVNSKNILGLLDIAEREAYNKQELHDLLLAGLGVTTDSPYRVLNDQNTPSISTISQTARDDQRVKAAESSATANALDSEISVNVGNDPNNVAMYEIRTGEDWLSEISRFQIANRFGNVMIQNLRTQEQQLYAGVLSRLEGEYNIANFAALTDEARFNSDYFSGRNGFTEGSDQTQLSSSLAGIKEAELNIKAFESWLSDYRSGIIEHWGEQLGKRPYLAPYFYKAMFDFNMEDTFYHQSGAAQTLKYGMQALNSIGSFLGNLTGFKRPALPPRKIGQTAVSNSPKGETITQTTYQFE